MHLQCTLPHYAKALLSKKTGQTIYDIVSNSPSIIINGQETIKGRRKETSGLLSLFNKAYALLPQVLIIRPISCCFVSKMSKIFLSPMSSHLLGLCVSRPWTGMIHYPSTCYHSVKWSRNFPRINYRAFPAHLRLSMPLLPAWPGLNLDDWPPRLIRVLRLGFICFFTLKFMYVYFIIPKDFLWVGESEDTGQSLLRLSWERWGHFYHFSDYPELSQCVF